MLILSFFFMLVVLPIICFLTMLMRMKTTSYKHIKIVLNHKRLNGEAIQILYGFS